MASEASRAYWMKVGVWMLLAYRYLKTDGYRGKCVKEGRRKGACLVVKAKAILLQWKGLLGILERSMVKAIKIS